MSGNNTDIFKELTDRFIDNSFDRLDELDKIIDRIYKDEGDRGLEYKNFVQEIHSLKGSAGTFGFHLVSTVSHRLEDYLESSRRLEKSQWLDVQKFIDVIREIFELGEEPDASQHDKFLGKIPSSSSQEESINKSKTILLVMSSGIIRKHLGVELATNGYDISFANNPIEGLDMILKIKPDAVLSSLELPALTGLELNDILHVLKSTKDIPFVLMTSNQEMAESYTKNGVPTVFKDKNLPANILSKLDSMLA